LASRFPQLEILGLLGKGGMGAVYKARQQGLDRLVAVKILPPEISGDPTFAERFTREARALARLSHPNIVAVYDFGRTPTLPSPSGREVEGAGDLLPSPSGRGAGGEGEGLFYFIMEYVDGVNLRQAIQSGGMSPKEALAIVPQICDALQFAHDEGIVHRDIKPENILVDKRGRVKIADFGLAKLLGQAPGDVSLTGTQQVMGTLRYMAPEQLEGTKAVDHRADIYSLGVVFYELLTGELPIGRFAPPSKKVEIDVRLDEVVLRALEKEPEQRYQHASELKTEVESVRLNPAPAKAFRPGPASTPGSIAGHEMEPAVGKPFNAPRLSRCALWGVIWAPCVLFVLVFVALVFIHPRAEKGSPGPTVFPAQVFMVVAGLFALVGVMAPFGTTILGVVAIGQIRRSGNKLYGLPLAVFDAWLFPMLLLDSIILTAVAAVTLAVLVLLIGLQGPLNNLVEILDEALTLGIGLSIIAWVDYRIARAVWRNATGYQAPAKSAAAIPSTPAVQTPGAPAQRVATGYGSRPPVQPAAPLVEIPPVRCSPWRRARLLATLTVWTAVLVGGFGYFMPLIWNEWWPWVYKEYCEASVNPQSGAYGTVHLRAERKMYCWGQHDDRPILKRPWVGTATIDLPGQGAAMTLEMDAFADKWRLTRPDGQEIQGPFEPPLRLVTPWMRDAGIDISKPGVQEEAAALIGLVKDAAKGVLLGVAPSPDYLPPGGTKIGPFTVVGSLSWQRSIAEGAVGPVDRRLLAGALLLAIWLPGIPIIVRRHRRRLAAARETEQRYRLGTIGFWVATLCLLGAAATSILPWVWLSSSSPTSMFRNAPMPDLGAFSNWYGAMSGLAFLTVLVLCFLTDFFNVRRSWQPRAMVTAGAIVVVATGILFWRLTGPPATARVVTIDFHGYPQMVALVSTVGCWQEHELCRGSFPESSLPKTFDQQSGLGLQLAMALGLVLLMVGCVTSWRARRRAAEPTHSVTWKENR
jgi:predicted Ser/Thr protein kinase